MKKRHMPQIATKWSTLGSDGYAGHTFSAAKLLDSRWEERQEIFQDFNGEQRTSRTIVYVLEDITEGDFLALGDASDEASPHDASPAGRRVEGFTKVPNLRGMDVTRKAFLL